MPGGGGFEKERRELLDAYLANPIDAYRLVRAHVALSQAIARYEANRQQLQIIKDAAGNARMEAKSNDRTRV